MAKPTTTGRDYGHKTYMSTTSYPEAMARPSDKQYDNRVRRPHSDDKKPYMDDEYPEMEHFFTPYDPPNFVPPGIPDDPRIPPNRPDNPSTGKEPDQEKEADFTGCLFSWNAGPSQIKVGETTWHSIDVGPNDPLVGLYVNYGPVALLATSAAGVMQCINGPYPTCFVRAIAVSFNPEEETEHGSIDGSYMAQIVGVTARGFTCTWDLTVTYCPPTVEIEWDHENSAETCTANSEVLVYITGGAPPFNWEVSGTDFTLKNQSGYGRANTLIAGPQACGSAVITVTDFCDEEASGAVRSTTSGRWQFMSGDCFLAGYSADYWNVDCIGGVLNYIYPCTGVVISGQDKQTHKHDWVVGPGGEGGFQTSGECEASAASNCGSVLETPCLAFPASITLEHTGCVQQGFYVRCGDTRAYHRTCAEAYGYWYYLRASLRLDNWNYKHYRWTCPA